MKTLKLFCLLWMLVTTLSCKTIEYVDRPVTVDVELTDPPIREELLPREDGESLSKLLLRRVEYYSDLVAQWENWGILVYEAIDEPLPESLELAKKQMEAQDE